MQCMPTAALSFVNYGMQAVHLIQVTFPPFPYPSHPHSHPLIYYYFLCLFVCYIYYLCLALKVSLTALLVKQCISLVGLHPFRPPPNPFQLGGEFSCRMVPMAYTRSLGHLPRLRYQKQSTIIVKQQSMQFEQVFILSITFYLSVCHCIEVYKTCFP